MKYGQLMLVAKNIHPKVNRQITTRNEVCYHLYFLCISTLKFQACYITGQWGEFTVKTRMLLSASKFLFLTEYKISATEY